MTARLLSYMAARTCAIHPSRCATKERVTGKLHFVWQCYRQSIFIPDLYLPTFFTTNALSILLGFNSFATPCKAQ